MAMTPFSDLASGVATLNLAWAECYGLSHKLVEITRSSPDAYTAERSIQEVLLKLGCRNPISGAARLIDGPLAVLVATALSVTA